MTHVFDGSLPLVGADYQRAFPLADGRVLWLFQDAFVGTPTAAAWSTTPGLALLPAVRLGPDAVLRGRQAVPRLGLHRRRHRRPHPLGRFDQQPAYWNGSSWTSDTESAVAVIPTDGRAVNPTQVAVVDDTFVAVTLADDWWGDTVHLDTAPTPHGPWTTYDTVTVDALCAECNTYFASIVPFGATDTSFWIAVSNNHWDGDVMADYRPSVVDVASPPV